MPPCNCTPIPTNVIILTHNRNPFRDWLHSSQQLIICTEEDEPFHWWSDVDIDSSWGTHNSGLYTSLRSGEEDEVSPTEMVREINVTIARRKKNV